MRQSSDDLTRLTRTYVVSGNPKWQEQYQEVIDIRAGKRPRPAQYHKIYWDFRAAGIPPTGGEEPAMALTELMKRAGFTDEEFAKLNEAERTSMTWCALKRSQWLRRAIRTRPSTRTPWR